MSDAFSRVQQLVRDHTGELVAVRRDLHAHPEIGNTEVRTTRVLRERLQAADLRPRVLPGGTGLVVDVGDTGGPLLALRADIDALPLQDQKSVSYRSRNDGVAHACGHDVHTAVVLGAAIALAALRDEGLLDRGVRLVFQPAEEMTPGGALGVIEAGGLDRVERILALHCDPRLPAGQMGVRVGPITAAADQLTVRLSGPGGHTARPHLTADLVHALGTVVTGLPGALSRRVDPRAGLSVVWGRVRAGSAANAIPESGEIAGTLRTLDADAWDGAPELVHELVAALVEPFGVRAAVTYERGVPPVVNDRESAELLQRAAGRALGPEAVVGTEQSLGGEDFAWYQRSVPGALARLGVASPDARHLHDLHQGGFDVDERAIPAGVRVLLAAVLDRGRDEADR